MAEGAAGSYRSLTRNHHQGIHNWAGDKTFYGEIVNRPRPQRTGSSAPGETESRETLRRTSGLRWPPGVVGFGRGLREGMPWPEAQWRASTLSFKGTVYLSQRSRLEPCRLTLGKQVRATL